MTEPAAEVLKPFLNPEVVLVPVPRSAPLREGALWPAHTIAQVFQSAGYGRSVEPLVERISAVPKSAIADEGRRPMVFDHKASLKIHQSLYAPGQITLVDDVLTMGRTSAACAELLAETYPEAKIRIFAVMRTMGFVNDIERVFNPTVGTVTSYPSGKTHRDP